MPAKTKRPAKFAHLKVGDDVVIEDERGCRSIDVVTSVDESQGTFSVGHRGYRKTYTRATGSGKPNSYNSRPGKAVIADESEKQLLCDEAERQSMAGKMLSTFNPWHLLTLPQLRRIRDELEAVKRGQE